MANEAMAADLRIVVPDDEFGPIEDRPEIFGVKEQRNFDGDIPTTVISGLTRVSGAEVGFTREIPDDLIDDEPVLLVQGFMGPELVYGALRHALSQHGRETITVGRAGFQTPCAALSKQHRFSPHKVTAQTPWSVQKALGIPRVHAVGHSMGGPIVFNKAVRRPGRFASVTSIGGAGQTGHNTLGLALRLPRAVREIGRGLPAMKDEYGAAGVWAVAKYFGIDPRRTLFEARDVSRQDIRPAFAELSRLGVPTAVGAFVNDAFFDESTLEEQVGSQADVFRIIRAELAGHIAPQLEPELVAWEIDEMIRELTDLTAIKSSS